MCLSPESIHIPPQKDTGNSLGGRGGVLKAKLLEKKSMKLNWNFLGGKGVQNEKPSVGEYGYFLELQIKIKIGINPLSYLINFLFLSQYRTPCVIGHDHSNPKYCALLGFEHNKRSRILWRRGGGGGGVSWWEPCWGQGHGTHDGRREGCCKFLNPPPGSEPA